MQTKSLQGNILGANHLMISLYHKQGTLWFQNVWNYYVVRSTVINLFFSDLKIELNFCRDETCFFVQNLSCRFIDMSRRGYYCMWIYLCHHIISTWKFNLNSLNSYTFQAPLHKHELTVFVFQNKRQSSWLHLNFKRNFCHPIYVRSFSLLNTSILYRLFWYYM